MQHLVATTRFHHNQYNDKPIEDMYMELAYEGDVPYPRILAAAIQHWLYAHVELSYLRKIVDEHWAMLSKLFENLDQNVNYDVSIPFEGDHVDFFRDDTYRREGEKPNIGFRLHGADKHDTTWIHVEFLKEVEDDSLLNLVRIIDDFDQECEAREHTDTGEVWEIFKLIRKGLIKNRMRQAANLAVMENAADELSRFGDNGYDVHLTLEPLQAAIKEMREK